MKRTILITATLMVALAACRPAGDAAKSGESMAEGGAVVDGPTGKTGDPVASEVVGSANIANTFTDLPPAPDIPERFHGRWGLTANDCQPGRADAKGLLVITPDRLTFYESRGTLKNVEQSEPGGALTANFAFTGEGMAWERRIRFERQGDKLRRVEDGSEEGPVDLTYTACPSR